MSTKLAKKALNSFLATPRSKADSRAGVVVAGGEDERGSAAAKKRSRRRDPSRVAADGLPAVRSGLKKAKLGKKLKGSNLAAREGKRTRAAAPSALEEVRREQKESEKVFARNLAYFKASSRVETSSENKMKVLRKLAPLPPTAEPRTKPAKRKSGKRKSVVADGFFSDTDSEDF